MAVKWNGQSVYQLTQKRQRVRNLDTALGELGRVRSEAQEAYMVELGRILERDPQNLQVGGWECEDAPLKTCVYDLSTSEQDDACIFCDKPNERK